MVLAGAVHSLLDGFSITSINVMFDEGGTGEVSNIGSEDTRFLLKDVVQALTSIEQESL